MAKVRVMYWKEIPVQVQAANGPEQVSKPLDERFQQGADAISMFDGSAGTDDYLMAWNWGEYLEGRGIGGRGRDGDGGTIQSALFHPTS